MASLAACDGSEGRAGADASGESVAAAPATTPAAVVPASDTEASPQAAPLGPVHQIEVLDLDGRPV